METQNRILVVSESPLFGYAVKDLFPDAAVDMVGDGVDALYMCYNETYHLVISDFETPILSILEFLKIIRSVDDLKHLPVMVVKPSSQNESLQTNLCDDPYVKIVDPCIVSGTLKTEAEHFVHD